MHGSSQNGLPEHLQASYMLCGCQNRLYKTVQVPNTLCGVKTDYTNPYKSPKRFAVSLEASCTLCCSENGHTKPLQPYYTLCGSQNGLTNALQFPNTLCGRQNELTDHLQPSTL